MNQEPSSDDQRIALTKPLIIADPPPQTSWIAPRVTDRNASLPNISQGTVRDLVKAPQNIYIAELTFFGSLQRG